MNKLLKISTIAVMALIATAALGIHEASAGYYTTVCNAYGYCWDVYVPTCNYYTGWCG
jgi:hypothetical protein